MISTCWPAASTVLPLGARSKAVLPTSMLGATSTTSPSRAVMRPPTVMPPAPPMLLCTLPSPKRKRPASASASLMRSADAVNPAVSMTAPAPTAMPDWLTSTRRPLDDRAPKIADGVLVTTRLIDRLLALGCTNVVLLPAAIEKLCQLIAEWLVPRPFCVTTRSWFGAGVLKLAWPSMATPPTGSAWPWPDPLANPVASASASSAGLNTMACPVDPIDPVDRIPWE